MVRGSITPLLSTAVPMPAPTAERVLTLTLITLLPPSTQSTAPRSTPRGLIAPPALPMSAQPPRKATALPTEAGRTMTELSTAEPRPVPPVGTVPMSMQITL